MPAAGRPVDAHLAAGPAGHGRRRRDERLRPGAERRPGPIRGELRGVHPGRQRGLPGHRRRGTRVSGSTTSRPVRSARWPRSSCPTWCRPGRPGSAARLAHAGRRRADRRRHPRQLLAVRPGRPHPQARARRPAAGDLPHPGPGQGRRQPGGALGRGAGPPGPGRGRDRRLRRRRGGLLFGGGRAARRAVRRPPGADRHRGPRRGPRLLQPRRPGPGPAGGRAARAAIRSSCLPGGSSRSRG